MFANCVIIHVKYVFRINFVHHANQDIIFTIIFVSIMLVFAMIMDFMFLEKCAILVFSRAKLVLHLRIIAHLASLATFFLLQILVLFHVQMVFISKELSVKLVHSNVPHAYQIHNIVCHAQQIMSYILQMHHA